MNFQNYVNVLPYASKLSDPVVYQNYMDEESRIYQQFANDLYEDLGIENNPKREILFQKAWDRGHSSGYHEVYNVALDLVDLIL